MARKMHINRLDKEELEYLLQIRGVALGTCDEMRKRLASAIRLEHEGTSIKYPPYPFTFEEDGAAIQKVLDNVAALLTDFDAGRKSSEALKLQTKMAYVMERMENLTVGEDAELQAKKSELLATTLTLIDRLHEKMESFEAKRVGVVPTAVHLLESQVGQQTFQAGIEEASGSSPIRSAARVNPLVVKPVFPHKWELQKFSGDQRVISIHSFFERVEELRIARNVSKEALLEAGIDLFADKAYQFYKDCRKRVSDWDGLVEEFKAEYLLANHSDLLFDELRKRTQHSSETIGVYLAVMASYFSRLGCPLSEEVKLKILTKNLHPFYQERLRDPLPTSISELREVCRRLEERRDWVNNYVEPTSSRRSNVLERDLAYVGAKEEVKTVDVGPNQSRRTGQKAIVCFKCKQPGHKAIGCAVSGGKRCFKCNRDGYTVKTCPNCSTQQGNDKRRP